LKRTLTINLALLALLALRPLAAGSAPRSISDYGHAAPSTTEDATQRLRASHVKDLQLNAEAETMYGAFEDLANEAIESSDEQLKQVWDSSDKALRLDEDASDKARKATRLYVEIFRLTDQLRDQESAMDALDAAAQVNAEGASARKDQEKRVKKTRKKITKLKKKVREELKGILEMDGRDHVTRLNVENWLAVSTGVLRDIREQRWSEETSSQESKAAGTEVKP